MCSAVRSRGFKKDVGLTGNHFAPILSVLYAGYTTMQVPSYAFYFWSWSAFC